VWGGGALIFIVVNRENNERVGMYLKGSKDGQMERWGCAWGSVHERINGKVWMYSKDSKMIKVESLGCT
jgi:hypothetical protein